MKRCAWIVDEQMAEYHDREWGVPVHDDRILFEFLVLGGAQAGLSWAAVLRKREGYRRAFAGFDPRRVARFDTRRIADLLTDPAIIRNRQKVNSAVRNAAAFLRVQQEFGSFDAYLRRFAPAPSRAPRSLAELPARTAASDALSDDLIRRGFSFVGSTICYAFMQTVGMVNDHVVGCFRRSQVEKLIAADRRRRAAR
jgi:DNA-3-methyladenine glycosylase I